MIKSKVSASSSLMQSFLRVSTRCLNCNGVVSSSALLPLQRSAVKPGQRPAASHLRLESEVENCPPVADTSHAKAPAVLKQAPLALCSACRQPDVVHSLLMQKQQQQSSLNDRYNGLWSKCLACAGCDDFAAACRNAQCEILYDRTIAYKDLGRAADEVCAIESCAGDHKETAAHGVQMMELDQGTYSQQPVIASPVFTS